jgi:hypothetical protein
VSVADVTVSRRCEGCGASLEGRRRQTRTCGDRCRQRVSRAAGYPGNHAPLQLTFELRRWLRGEIDRRRREQVAARERAERSDLRAERRVEREGVFEVAA